jgi:hypothetical protein
MNRFDAAIRAQLGEHIPHVKSRRPLGNAQPCGDFFVAQTLGHQAQHLLFAQRQWEHRRQSVGRRRMVRRVSIEQAKRVSFGASCVESRFDQALCHT